MNQTETNQPGNTQPENQWTDRQELERVAAKLASGMTPNPVIDNLVNGGPIVRALRQALLSHADPRFFNAYMVSGLIENQPVKRGGWFHFTVRQPQRGGVIRWHIRCIRKGHAWVGRLKRESFVGIVGTGYIDDAGIPAGNTTYIFEFSEDNMNPLGGFKPGLLTWEILSEGSTGDS